MFLFQLLFAHQSCQQDTPNGVYLVTNEDSKDPVRTVQIGRKIRMPEQGKVMEAVPPDKRADVTKM